MELSDRVEDDPRLASLPPTPVTGLSADEAARRRAAGLGNDADIRTGRTYLEIIRENALNPVNLLLTAIAGVLVLLGLYGDAAVTLVLVVVNVVVGFYQQARAKQTLDKLSVLTRPTATIVRDGQEIVTDQREAVLGDALRVRQGDQLMLDGRVLAGEHGGRRVAADRRGRPDPEVRGRRGALGQRLRQWGRHVRGHARRRRLVRQPADHGRRAPTARTRRPSSVTWLG